MIRILALLVALSFAAGASAQQWPTRPLRYIITYPPGGPADILARMVAAKLGDRLKQQVVVDNRPGGGGNIGAELTARAAPDGYTIFMMASTHAANMTLYAKPGYSVTKDFAHITNIAGYPLLFVVHPRITAKDMREFIVYARTNPGRLSYASAGSGGGAHLAMELFRSMVGLEMVHIPYKGQGPALQDVIGGQVELTFASVSAALPHVSAGRLRVLGISSAERLRSLPEVPTVSEAGVAGYELESWLGMSAPAGTPTAIVQRLNEETAAVVADPEFAERLRRDGAASKVSSPERFSAYVEGEVTRWAKLVRESGAKPE